MAKKNPEERLVVVAHRPDKRRKIIMGALFTLLIVAMVFYYIGFNASLKIQGDARAQTLALQQELAQLQTSYKDSRREAAQANVSSEIDTQAIEQVRGLVRELEQQIAEQKEEIIFYKGLMAPSEKEAGLGVRSWEVESSGDKRYEYRMIVQQLATVHRLMKGAVSVSIVGELNGMHKVYSLRDLSQQVKEEKIKLRFKYFQTISGEIELPLGFEVQRVDIAAYSSGKKSQSIERSFNWIVQEN